MLVITRKLNERILIGDAIRVTLIDSNFNRARIGIDAPPDTKIYREEIAPVGFHTLWGTVRPDDGFMPECEP